MERNINLNDKSSASQAKQILAYLQQGNRITGIEALNLFGCFRLPARISDLREEGIDIKDEYVTTPTGKRVKSYWIQTI